jgi:hypothetical protein
MPQESPEPKIITVKVAKGDVKARDMMAQRWVLIGKATYVDYGDNSGCHEFPLGWPESAGDVPMIYPD